MMEQMNVFNITSALADPTRLSVMMYLIRDKASVTELMNHLNVSQSNLSNHLSVLKNANLIKSTSMGRQKIYELANAEVAQLIEVLLNLQHITPKKEKDIKPIQFARTCYDHLAGKLGVALFEKLIMLQAIQPIEVSGVPGKQFFKPEIELGPAAANVFNKIGIDLSALKNARRRFAFGCLDWTERTPHLAGDLGAIICRTFLEKNWIVRKPDTRAIGLTTIGKLALKDLIGLDMDRLN